MDYRTLARDKRVTIPVAIVVMLFLGMLLTWTVLTGPVETEPDVEGSSANGRLSQALALAGVPEAVPDVNGSRLLVRYNVPDGMDREAAFYTVLLTSFEVAGEAPLFVLQVYEAYEPVEEVRVAGEDVAALARGELDEAAFEERLERIS